MHRPPVWHQGLNPAVFGSQYDRWHASASEHVKPRIGPCGAGFDQEHFAAFDRKLDKSCVVIASAASGVDDGEPCPARDPWKARPSCRTWIEAVSKIVADHHDGRCFGAV